jgi:hypothetical protein
MKRLALSTLTLALLVALAGPASALARDRDHDGLPDRWEKRHHLSLHHKSGQADPDRDKVDNRNEFVERTDPRDRDSDNDGVRDGREDPDRDHLRNAGEDAAGMDPRDPDTDDDGVEDGAEAAGIVESFENGVLVIRLSGGGSVEGAVTDGTEIECESEGEAEDEELHSLRHASAADEPVAEGDEPGEDGDQEHADQEHGDHEDGDREDEGHEQGEDGEDEDACSADHLQAGVAVHEAELSIGAGGAVFSEVQLIMR